MLTRRAFLARFGIGLGAALTLAALPTSAIAHLALEPAAQRLACEHMLRAYRAHTRGLRLADHPRLLHVAPGLFTAYQGELVGNERFAPGRAPEHFTGLMFKGITVYPSAELTGWDLAFIA